MGLLVYAVVVLPEGMWFDQHFIWELCHDEDEITVFQADGKV